MKKSLFGKFDSPYTKDNQSTANGHYGQKL